MSWEISGLSAALHTIVSSPSIAGALVILLLSFLNELLSIFPLGFFLAGEFALFGSSLNSACLLKLLFLVCIPVGAGMALGSLFVYSIAYFGGKPIIDKFGKYARTDWSKVNRLEHRLQSSGSGIALFLLLRSTPFFPNVPLTAASGVLRIPLRLYLPLSAFGTMLRLSLMFAMAWGGVGLF